MPTLCVDGPRLIGVHPASPDWPVNLLRFHLVFDREMDPFRSAAAVSIETAAGEPVRGALVDLPDGLWSPDGKVMTLLFHPARIKQGLRAYRQEGAALVAFQDYCLIVEPSMRDIEGQSLDVRSRTAFRAVPAQTAPLDLTGWKIMPPARGSRDVVTLKSGCLLDALSVRTALRVIDGLGRVHPVEMDVVGETVFLHPSAPWPETAILQARPTLEDVCGNRIGRAFEAMAGAEQPEPGEWSQRLVW